MSPEQIKKLFAQYLKEQKKKKGNKLKSPGANIANQSLAGLRSSSGNMLKQMISSGPKLAKRGGKVKKKK